MKKLLLLLISSILLFGAQPKFLMPEEAFKPAAKLNDKMQIEATIELGKDIYLYEDALKFEIKNQSGIRIKDVKKPKSVEHHGDMVYLESPVFIINFQKEAQVSGLVSVEFELSYQGCSEQGLCYEPYTESFTFNIDSSKLADGTAKEKSGADKKEQEKIEVNIEVKKEHSESDSIADTIKEEALLLFFLRF